MRHQLSFIVWFSGLVGLIVLIWQWPSTSKGCHAFNCTYLPLPPPQNDCYWIVPNGQSFPNCGTCRCRYINGQMICQTPINGTTCYNRAGDSKVSNDVCADFTTCYNLGRVLARTLVGLFGGLFIFLVGVCLCAARNEATTPDETQKLIPLKVLTAKALSTQVTSPKKPPASSVQV